MKRSLNTVTMNVSWQVLHGSPSVRSLAAYPSPGNFRFFHLGNRTSGNGSEVSSGSLSSLCLQNAVTLSTVNCTITPVNVSKSLLGFYRAIVSNDLGSVDITFSINKEGIYTLNCSWMFYRAGFTNFVFTRHALSCFALYFNYILERCFFQ